jgi:hypothetical protein
MASLGLGNSLPQRSQRTSKTVMVAILPAMGDYT